MGAKTKIDWCDRTWSPVTGCLHECEYCYARKLARRFCGYDPEYGKGYAYDGKGNYILDKSDRKFIQRANGKVMCAPYPFDFAPTLHRYNLNVPKHWKNPSNIFVCSMADLFGNWVPDEWIREVFEACEAAPWHRYLFLTKNPDRLIKMANAHLIPHWNATHKRPHPQTEEYAGILKLPVHDNWWFGSSMDNQYAKRFQGDFTWNTFTSIEPLMEHMNMGIGSFGSDKWTIIGAETGMRNGKVIPKREWVENIVEAADMTGVKVFMKESLRELMGDDFRQEFPWDNLAGAQADKQDANF